MPKPEPTDNPSIKILKDDSSNDQKKSQFSLFAFTKKIFSEIKGTKNKVLSYRPIKLLKSANRKHILSGTSITDKFLQFSQKTVEDVMVPRSDITAIKHNASLDELSKLIAKLPHSRTLVYEDNLDNIIGFVHIKDVFKMLVKRGGGKKNNSHNLTANSFQLRKILRKTIISAPSMKIIDLLEEMQDKRTYIAIVVDEYGGTDGIVTLEDIISQIIGDINDECHERSHNNSQCKIIDEYTILSHARVEVEYLEEILNIKLKNGDDEFHTIGGLVLAKVGKVPVAGTKISISNLIEIEVVDANQRILKQVKITLKPPLTLE